VRQQQSKHNPVFWKSNWRRRARAWRQDRAGSQFNAQHIGEMPGQLSSNLQILGGLAIAAAESRRCLKCRSQQHVYLQTLASSTAACKVVEGPGRHRPGWAAGS